MPVVLENIKSPVVLQNAALPPAYVSPSECRTICVGMVAIPGVLALLAMTDDTLAAVLATASQDIDSAMHYQGRKYFTLQTLEFPRIPFGSSPGVNQFGIPLSGPASLPLTPDTVVWDWEPGTNGEFGKAVVPHKVKLACIHQAAWLQNPQYAKRIEDIQSGVASHSIGTASESFARPKELGGGRMGFTGLGARAMQIMEKYKIGTGRLL